MRELLNRKSVREFFKTSYFPLALLLLICFFISYGCLTNCLDKYICNDWLKDFSLNLLAELIGILLFLILVNRTISINEDKEKKRFREIAFRHFKLTLNRQLNLLFYMLKASVEVKPENPYEKIEDLFDDTYFNEVGFLDLLKTAPVLTSNGEEMDWLDYLYSEFSSLKSALYKVVDRYSFYLDSEIVDLLEEVADAGFISFITVIREAKQCNNVELQGDLLSECKTLLMEYTSLFLKLVELYNQSVASKSEIKIDSSKWSELWSNKVRPKIGDSRIQISRSS